MGNKLRDYRPHRMTQPLAWEGFQPRTDMSIVHPPSLSAKFDKPRKPPPPAHHRLSVPRCRSEVAWLRAMQHHNANQRLADLRPAHINFVDSVRCLVSEDGHKVTRAHARQRLTPWSDTKAQVRCATADGSFRSSLL